MAFSLIECNSVSYTVSGDVGNDKNVKWATAKNEIDGQRLVGRHTPTIALESRQN